MIPRSPARVSVPTSLASSGSASSQTSTLVCSRLFFVSSADILSLCSPSTWHLHHRCRRPITPRSHGSWNGLYPSRLGVHLPRRTLHPQPRPADIERNTFRYHHLLRRNLDRQSHRLTGHASPDILRSALGELWVRPSPCSRQSSMWYGHGWDPQATHRLSRRSSLAVSAPHSRPKPNTDQP